MVAKQKNIKLSIQFTAEDGVMVQADQTMIHTVVCNLLFNVAKFSPRGGHIEAGVRSDRSEVLASVQDNGTGMTPQAASALFALDRKKSTDETKDEKGYIRIMEAQ